MGDRPFARLRGGTRTTIHAEKNTDPLFLNAKWGGRAGERASERTDEDSRVQPKSSHIIRSYALSNSSSELWA